LPFEIVHHHFVHTSEDAHVLAKLDRLEVLLTTASDNLAKQIHSLTTLVQGIPAKLQALIQSSGGSGVSEADLQALADEVAQDAAAIQADFATPAPAAPPPSPTA
jgi:hypothetical protein